MKIHGIFREEYAGSGLTEGRTSSVVTCQFAAQTFNKSCDLFPVLNKRHYKLRGKVGVSQHRRTTL